MKIKLVRTLLGIWVVLWLAACAQIPDSLGYTSQNLNQAAASDYATMMQKYQKQGKIDQKSRTALRIKRVFEHLLPVANAHNRTGLWMQWQMTVIRSDEANAWAMPGGKMAFHTGLVEKLKLSDAEIAAVIGHEMTHVLSEHGKKQLGQQIATQLAIQAGSAIVLSQTQWDPQWVDLTTKALATYGIGLPYSREHEYEADVGGVYLMAHAGYNPEAALTVWNKMNVINDNNHQMIALLSTHPTNNQRINRIRQILPEAMLIYQQNRRW